MLYRMRPSPGNRLHRLLDRVEGSGAVDPLAERLSRTVTATTRRSGTKWLFNGTWLGHALHPVLTDFADGAWMACSFLDIFGPRDAAPAARRLAGFGLLAAVPTALSGLAEWSETEGKERRVGLLHAGTSSAAFALYGCSYLARRRERHVAGVVLGVVGGVVAVIDGYVGGHLTLALGVGVGRTAFLGFPEAWTVAVDADALSHDRPVQACVAGSEIVLVSRGDAVFALADRCNYRGGQLHAGEVHDDGIVCPRDGCTFRLHDGAVLRGPASLPQPVLATRVNQGRIEVRSTQPPPYFTDPASTPCTK